MLEHDLPGRDQLDAIAAVDRHRAGRAARRRALDAVLDAAAGLTRHGGRGRLRLSLVRHGRLAAEPLWELKAGALKKSGLLTLHRGGETFAGLGGLEALKGFCTRALRPAADRAGPRPAASSCSACRARASRPSARPSATRPAGPRSSLDVGALEGRPGRPDRGAHPPGAGAIDAMAPCVAIVDEIEKALAGVQSSGQTDSGVTAGLFGTVLTWLNDHTSDVFFVATSNDISKLPPELSRAERFDGIFFLDLPGREQKDLIWRLYLEKYRLDPGQRRPRDLDWTGAEIQSCCRLAALLEIPLMEAAQNIVPVAGMLLGPHWRRPYPLIAVDSAREYLGGVGPTAHQRAANPPCEASRLEGPVCRPP